MIDGALEPTRPTTIAVDEEPLASRPQESQNEPGQAAAAPEVNGQTRRNIAHYRGERHAARDLVVHGTGPEKAQAASMAKNDFQFVGQFYREHYHWITKSGVLSIWPIADRDDGPGREG